MHFSSPRLSWSPSAGPSLRFLVALVAVVLASCVSADQANYASPTTYAPGTTYPSYTSTQHQDCTTKNYSAEANGMHYYSAAQNTSYNPNVITNLSNSYLGPNGTGAGGSYPQNNNNNTATGYSTAPCTTSTTAYTYAPTTLQNYTTYAAATYTTATYAPTNNTYYTTQSYYTTKSEYSGNNSYTQTQPQNYSSYNYSTQPATSDCEYPMSLARSFVQAASAAAASTSTFVNLTANAVAQATAQAQVATFASVRAQGMAQVYKENATCVVGRASTDIEAIANAFAEAHASANAAAEAFAGSWASAKAAAAAESRALLASCGCEAKISELMKTGQQSLSYATSTSSQYATMLAVASNKRQDIVSSLKNATATTSQYAGPECVHCFGQHKQSKNGTRR